MKSVTFSNISCHFSGKRRRIRTEIVRLKPDLREEIVRLKPDLRVRRRLPEPRVLTGAVP